MSAKPDPPRLFFVTYSFRLGVGGIETCSRLLARVLARNATTLGYQCELIATRDSKSEVIEGVRTIATGGSKRALLKAVRHGGRHSQVIYGHINLARSALAPPWRRPLAILLYGIEVWQSPGTTHRLAVRTARHLWIISEFSRQRASTASAMYKRSTVCWIGTLEDDIVSDAPSRSPRVLMVGRLAAGRDKGHRGVLAAWPKVRQAIPDAELVIAGGGSDLEAIRELAKGIAGVTVLGHVDEETLAGLWTDTRVMALPSRGEGFGIVYADAMRRGIPVVVSNNDAGQEIAGQDGAGIAVDPSDEKSVAAAIVELLADDRRNDHRSAVARNRWAHHYSFSAFEARTVAMLRSWLDERPGRIEEW